MHHLACGMNSRIGAPGGDGVDGAMGIELGDGVFQHPLHTGALALSLPATKRRTLVLQAEGNPSDRRLLSCRRGL